jgi:pimeloyl-ACP methyl ester carboxylesterase
LAQVTAPTLLLVGGEDVEILQLNRIAYSRLGGVRELQIVPGANHLFEETGALETVAQQAAEWFTHYLALPHRGGTA